MQSHRLVLLLSALAALSLAGSALGASKTLVVKIGANRTYTRSQLHPGETVLCRYQGHALAVTAPVGDEEATGAGWPKPGTTDRSIFTLNASVTAKRAFHVTCVRGGYHSALVTLP